MLKFEEDVDREQIHYDESKHTKVAKRLLIYSIIALVIDLIIYIIDMFWESYIDFGFCFEFASLILVISSLVFIKTKSIKKARTASLLSLISISLLFLYDIIIILLFDGFYAVEYLFYVANSLSLILIVLIFNSYKRLAKVDELSDGAIDSNWFYEDK